MGHSSTFIRTPAMPRPSQSVSERSLLPRATALCSPDPPKRRNLTVRQIPGVDPDSRTPSGGPFFRGRKCIRMASEPAIRNSRQPGQATGGTPPKPDAEAFSRCRVSSPQRPTPGTDAENLTVRRIFGAVPLHHEPLPSKTCKIAIPLPETDLGGNWGPLDL